MMRIVLVFAFSFLFLVAGCFVREEIPQLHLVKRGDGQLVNPNQKRIEGIGISRVGDFVEVRWSIPAKNDYSPMPLVARAAVSIHLNYAASGVPTVYEDKAEVDVLPGQTRLIAGVIRIPLKNVSEYALGYLEPGKDSAVLIDSATFHGPDTDGLVFAGGDLEFHYLEEKDGIASCRWTARGIRQTQRIAATASNATSATVDTAAFPVRAVLILISLDGKEILRDGPVEIGPQKAGTICEVHGIIRLPSLRWKDVDWKKTRVEWNALPEQKAGSSRIVRMRVTAYCQGPCKICETCGRTANQGNAHLPGCAAARTIPFGAVVVVPGFGPLVVDDRGRAITAGRLDIRMKTHREARAYGLRYLDVEIL